VWGTAARSRSHDAESEVSRNPNDNTKTTALEAVSGRVRFDDRGNAVWETWRGRRLEHPALQLADEPAGPTLSLENRKGKIVGYDPYQSGMLAKVEHNAPRRKTDLRELSKWIELQRRIQSGTEE
jgi:hypothetical protein